MYFKLDHFFVSSPLLTSTVASEFNPIIWSDHSSVQLDLTLSTSSTKTCHWCLNDSLLHNPVTRDQLSCDSSVFFQLNENTVAEVSTLWEAHKAFFRGQSISAGSRLKKENCSSMVLSPHSAMQSGGTAAYFSYGGLPTHSYITAKLFKNPWYE